MRCCIIMAAIVGIVRRATNYIIPGTMVMRIMICATMMMRMICVDMIPISMICPRSATAAPIGRPISPIPWRYPACPNRCPEPIINQRAIDVMRLYDIRFAVDVGITYDLNRRVSGFILLYIDTGDILVDILCQNSLNQNQVSAIAFHLHNTQVIYIAVTIQVQIGDVTFLRI